ncbi:hypothetical protein VNO77_44014 [Canavalia gladiata]|uniref:Uncharacterized protein n=1 Tax=Canavalia gladiata TaxID=3824 RepID=A0AAN9PPZ7_CANGL
MTLRVIGGIPYHWAKLMVMPLTFRNKLTCNASHGIYLESLLYGFIGLGVGTVMCIMRDKGKEFLNFKPTFQITWALHGSCMDRREGMYVSLHDMEFQLHVLEQNFNAVSDFSFFPTQSPTLESLAADSCALPMGHQGYTECDKILLLTLEVSRGILFPIMSSKVELFHHWNLITDLPFDGDYVLSNEFKELEGTNGATHIAQNAHGFYLRVPHHGINQPRLDRANFSKCGKLPLCGGETGIDSACG